MYICIYTYIHTYIYIYIYIYIVCTSLFSIRMHLSSPYFGTITGTLIWLTIPSVISNHGVVSIFDKCHQNIIYGKINICVRLPPTYVQEAWDYEKANIENIKKAISNFDWNKAFENLSVDEKVDFLDKAL